MTHKIPDHIKELRGTLRPSSQRPAAGERLTESPETPDTLSRGAKKEWKSLAPVLVELGTLCRADLRAFEVDTDVFKPKVDCSPKEASSGEPTYASPTKKVDL